MRKKISLAIMITALLCALSFHGTAAFRDVSGELTPIVDSLHYVGIIDGFPDGTFKPQEFLTRGQFCKIMVSAMPLKDTSHRYTNYTLFPDVAHTHWAARYINFAVSEPRFISGYPDGTFGPDARITEAQAITIAVRTLGYTIEDVGPFWPRDYINKAEEIGLLDGLSVTADASMTRARAARLIYNLLLCDTKDGGSFITANISPVVSQGSQGIIVATSETDPSLGTNAVKTGSGNICTSDNKPFPAGLVGVGGTVIYDRNQSASSANKIIGFIPDGTTQDIISVQEIKPAEIITTQKKAIHIPPATDVLINSSLKTYSEAWVDMGMFSTVTVHYDKSGAIRLIVCGTALQSGVFVLDSSYTGTYNPLARYFPSVNLNSRIYKNGVEGTFNSLRKYDVVTYNSANNTFYVFDYRVTGVFQSASPSIAAPTTVTVLNQEFRVLPNARKDFEKLKWGDHVTLLLTNNNEVAGVVPAGDIAATQYAAFYWDGAGYKLDLLASRMRIAFSPREDQLALSGQIVSVSQSPYGDISVGQVSQRQPDGENYYVADYRLGSRTVSRTVRVFDQIPNTTQIKEIAVEDISMPQIASSQIAMAINDSMGQVCIIVLRNALDDAYFYGRLVVRTTQGEDATSSTTVTATNATGSISGLNNGQLSGNVDTIGGVAFNANKRLVYFKPVKKLATVTLADFYFDEAVKIKDIYVPLASDVQVFLPYSGEFVTLERAKLLCREFEVYSEKELSDAGAKIRIIICR